MTGWVDCAEDWGMPFGTRMYKDVDGLRLRLGQYVNKRWHWWVEKADSNIMVTSALGSGIVPTQEWAAESAEAFAKKFLTPL